MFHFVLHVGVFPSRTRLHLEGGPIEIIRNKNKNKKLILIKRKIDNKFFKKQNKIEI